jgi:MerR family transcriptional regulator, light-induced transcriptional regulator
MKEPGHDLLSTRQAASLLGVGASSVKRWADEGLLPCVKTIGGHRRFLRSAVLALRQPGLVTTEGGSASSAAAWVERLVSEDVATIVDALDREWRRLGAWWLVAEELGEVIAELGRQWETGVLDVIQEHVASAHLARALARCGERIELPDGAPRALLMTAGGDDHTLGLALAEICLREAGWEGRWVGRRAPIDQAVTYIGAGNADLVAVSASVYSTDAASLAAQAERLGTACRARGAPLLLGGSGLWPDPPSYGLRIRSFRELHEHRDALAPR